MPEPLDEQPHDSRWSIHPTGQWILGNHPDATEQELRQLAEVLVRCKGAFAYSLSELPAYVGPLGPAHFELKVDKDVRCPPRRYTLGEFNIGEQKV